MTSQQVDGHSFKRPQTAQEAVLEAIRSMIARGEIPPGAPIVQESLAEAFGVSRLPVREALKILEGRGTVRYQAHRGYHVTKLEVSDILEIYELRGLLESHVVRNAVPLLGDSDLEAMRSSLIAMDHAADAKDMVAVGLHNRQFHFTLLERSGSARAVRLIRQLWDTTDPYRSLYFKKPLTRHAVNHEHRIIFAACADGDIERVVELLEVHRSHTVRDLEAMNGVWP